MQTMRVRLLIGAAMLAMAMLLTMVLAMGLEQGHRHRSVPAEAYTPPAEPGK